MSLEYLEEIEFEDQIEDYILEMEIQSYSSNTLKTYRSILENFHNFLIEENKVKDEKVCYVPLNDFFNT